MTDVALVPERHVLQRNNCVPANDARQTAQTLARDWIALVRHGRAAFLAFAKKFFDLQNFSALEMTKFCRPTIDTGGDDSERRHEFGMTITLHDLSRECCRFQSELFANRALNFWIDVRMRAHRSAYFADADALARLCQAFFRPAEFIIHQRELQPECNRLRVHAVTAANHRRHFEPARLLRDFRSQGIQIVEENLA